MDYIAKYGAPVKLPRPRSTMSSVALFMTKQVGEVDELKNSANIRVCLLMTDEGGGPCYNIV